MGGSTRRRKWKRGWKISFQWPAQSAENFGPPKMTKKTHFWPFPRSPPMRKCPIVQRWRADIGAQTMATQPQQAISHILDPADCIVAHQMFHVRRICFRCPPPPPNPSNGGCLHPPADRSATLCVCPTGVDGHREGGRPRHREEYRGGGAGLRDCFAAELPGLGGGATAARESWKPHARQEAEGFPPRSVTQQGTLQSRGSPPFFRAKRQTVLDTNIGPPWPKAEVSPEPRDQQSPTWGG